MLIIAVVLWTICVLLFQALMSGQKGVDTESVRNVSISSLLTESEIGTWLADGETNSTFVTPSSSQPLQDTKYSILPKMSNVSSSPVDENNNKSDSFPWNQHQSDQPEVESSVDLMDYVLTKPSQAVQADWNTVLGTFSHYADENWKEFLIQTEVPLIVRLYLADSSETVTISRIFNKNQDKKIHPKLKTNSAPSKDFEVLISTGSWLLTHESQFTLGEPYIEHDLDGTDSKNTFFFAAPRLLVHNKVKDKWRTAIVRHFDDKGLNMTFIDLDRKVVARRFMKRIS